MKTETVPVDSLVFDPANARKHGEKNLAAIKGSLQRFGQQKPIVVDAKGIVRAGNGTLAALIALGWKEAIIVRSSLAGSEATAYAIADNRTAELAEWDEDVLSQTLAALQIEDEDLAEATGYDEKEIEQLTMPEVSEDEIPPIPEEPITKTGDLWLLGEHRVLCGDSTKEGDVKSLLGKCRVDMCFSSPPYNSLNGGYKTDYSRETKRFYNSDCDSRTEPQWVEFCGAVLGLTASVLSSPESPVLWNVMYTANCRKGYGEVVFAGSHGLTVKETICWNKGGGFPTASKGILSRNWELIFVLSLGDSYSTTQGNNEPRWAMWDISRPKNQHDEHKATFPVELASRAISDFCTGDSVYDPFLGTGTTLIAAEQLKRKCYGMEISPAYCDVIVKRWETLTGKKATLATT